jgi:hypothetical protein
VEGVNRDVNFRQFTRNRRSFVNGALAFVGYSGLGSGILSGTFPISPFSNAIKLVESLEDQFVSPILIECFV